MGGTPKSSTTTTSASGSSLMQGPLIEILQNATSYPLGSPRLEAVNKAIAMFLTVDLKPISIIDGLGFKHFLKGLDPKYQPISRPHLIGNYVWPFDHETKVEVQDCIKGQMHHHDDLGSKCAYMCHLSNKTIRKSVLLSTPQIWLMKVSKKLA